MIGSLAAADLALLYSIVVYTLGVLLWRWNRCCALAGKMADAFGDELFSVFEDDAGSGLKETKGTPEAATSSKLG